MTFIDFHLHFCDSSREEELLRYCAAAGLKKAALISLPDLDRGNFNDEILPILKKYPGQFIGFGCLDYRLGRDPKTTAGQVKALKQSGFTGLKLWIGKPQAEREMGIAMESPGISAALDTAGSFNMPVLIHLADPPDFWLPGGPCESGFGTFNSWIDRGEELFFRFPGIRFIGAHLLFLAGGPGCSGDSRGFRRLEQILDDHPNLSLDTAPGRWFYRILAHNSKEAISFFTSCRSRILAGSDGMFFPAGYTRFPRYGVPENLASFNRIRNFLSGEGTVDDPYPGNRSLDPELSCLNLPEDTLRSVFEDNGAAFFL